MPLWSEYKEKKRNDIMHMYVHVYILFKYKLYTFLYLINFQDDYTFQLYIF